MFPWVFFWLMFLVVAPRETNPPLDASRGLSAAFKSGVTDQHDIYTSHIAFTP